MIKIVVSEWMAAQTDDNNKTRSLLDATQQISLKQPFMHGLILIPCPYKNPKMSIPVRGVYFVPKLYNCPKAQQARDENFYNCPQFACCVQ